MTKNNWRMAFSYIERYTCLIFTLHVTILTILDAINGADGLSIAGILLCLAIDFGVSVLSFFAFSDIVLKRAPVIVRYGICYLGLAAVGFTLGWFESVGSTLIAIAIGATIQLLVMLSNSARTKLYNAKLKEYQQRHSEDDAE
ncbi:MAG: hypothetical protein Q4B99_04855 [Clostridia bacterium]|nr:hypothetical protein [Clostridia bacterium]